MFVRLEQRKSSYTRTSKLGLVHEYFRKKLIAILRCDECDAVFEKDLKKIDRKRLDNSYFHCCGNCDSKKFGQRKSVESKKIWEVSAGSDIPVSKY